MAPFVVLFRLGFSYVFAHVLFCFLLPQRSHRPAVWVVGQRERGVRQPRVVDAVAPLAAPRDDGERIEKAVFARVQAQARRARHRSAQVRNPTIAFCFVFFAHPLTLGVFFAVATASSRSSAAQANTVASSRLLRRLRPRPPCPNKCRSHWIRQRRSRRRLLMRRRLRQRVRESAVRLLLRWKTPTCACPCRHQCPLGTYVRVVRVAQDGLVT